MESLDQVVEWKSVCLDGVGDGSFSPPAAYTLGTNLSAIAAGDLNDDSSADAVVGDANGVVVLLGNGNGGFGAVTTYPAASGRLSVTLCRFQSG